MSDIKSRKGKPFANAAAIAWQPAGPGMRRKILSYDDKMMMVHVEFEAGAVGQPHKHPHHQCAYVVSGVFDVTIDGKTERLRAGDTYLVDGNIVHGAVCVEPGVLVDIFTPMREDFI